MKVRELIEQLKKHDPNADVVALGHRDFFYPVLTIQKLLLKPTTIYEQNTRIATAYRDTNKNDEGEPCIELSIG